MGFLSNFFKKRKQTYSMDKPVLYKEKTPSVQINKLETLLKQNLPDQIREQITQDIQHIRSGDYGENQIRYILRSSYMPMYILHDVYLQENDLSAQIDFLVITRKQILIIECKNYHSSVRIDQNGQFILKKKDGSELSIPDPTEQNRRHMDMICYIYPEIKNRCCSLVVFTDQNMTLHTEKAPSVIRKQIIKSDKLVSFIRTLQGNSRLSDLSDTEMKNYADFFIHRHTDNSVDYTAKYQKYLSLSPSSPESKALTCPQCRQPVLKRNYGWYCTGKCGMKIDKIYGTILSDAQVYSLLNGESVQCATKTGATIVLPKIEQSSYQNKIFFQWQTKHKKI